MVEPWEKKKKIEHFAPDFDELDRIMDKLMQQLAPDFSSEDKPAIIGFSMRLGNDGKPIIEEFGNVSKRGERPVVVKAREPLVDIQKTEKNILITVELPGVEKKDMKLNVPDENTVEIIVAGANSFYKKLSLPEPVKKESAKAKFKNGILEIGLERKEQEKRSTEIKIE